ncbi:MAG: succinylglutamate desuccinylase, partial [Halobacteria archaeon]|nr:succinylglutamate desuccinylase [Halobacteria archaeon]
ERMIRSFLTVTGAVAGGEVSEEEPDYFTIDDSVSKRKDTEYELHVDNFELVREGEVYASTPEFRLVADRDFFPILMSEDGYEEILGFRGSRVATSLREATEAYRELDG